jgi:hypothetical protein
VECPPAPNAQPSCPGDACSFTCKQGFADCDANPVNGCEVNLTTDPANCGTCGKACAPGGACKNAVCSPSPDAGH